MDCPGSFYQDGRRRMNCAGRESFAVLFLLASNEKRAILMANLTRYDEGRAANFEKNMSTSHLQEIETRISTLSQSEKEVILERLANDLRATKCADFAASLAKMAADPDIQRELRDIESEFATAAEDGLENL